MKVLHLDTGRTLRGGQQQLLMLARSLRERQCEQLIVCPEDSALASEAAKTGLEVWKIPRRTIVSLRTLALLRRIITRRRFAILHAHDGRAQTISWLASSGLPVFRVASRRVAFLPRFRAIHRLKYTHTCHRVIAVSAFIRDLLVESGILPEHVEVIPDGVTVPKALPDASLKAALRRRWRLEESDFVIGHAGAFTKEKGQTVLLDAFRMLLPSVQNARLMLAGDGSLRESLEAQWFHQPCGNRVQFVGYLDDLSSLMNCLDLFVMPSLDEGLGSSALMAMAHGVPVVASRVGGLPEAVEDGKSGWLVQPGVAADLAQAITAATDRNRRLAAGREARERARLFSNDTMAERTLSLYRSAAKKSR